MKKYFNWDKGFLWQKLKKVSPWLLHLKRIQMLNIISISKNKRFLNFTDFSKNVVCRIKKKSELW